MPTDRTLASPRGSSGPITIAPSSLPDLVNEARNLSESLASGPCADARAGETRCLERENNIARRQGQGFMAYRHDRMCQACSAYWFAEMTALTLEQTLWQQRMAATDEQRRTG